jgi:hypothetical protein
MDSDCQTARSALKATQASLADALTWLCVATVVCGNGDPLVEGESFGMAGMGSPAPVGGTSLRGQLAQFLPGRLGFSGGGMEGSGLGERFILASDNSVGGSFQILQGYESRVDTPLTGDRGETYGSHPGENKGCASRSQHSSHGFGAFASLFTRPGGGAFDEDGDDTGYDVNRGFVTSAGGVGVGDRARWDGQRLATHQEPVGQLLYGPHGPGTRICGGIIARGLQAQFPDCFCLKTGCRFTTHVYKSNLGRMPPGAYYIRESDAYAYSELRLSPEAAALVPAGLLTSRNNTMGWKAII